MVANVPILVTNNESDAGRKKIGRSLAIRLLFEGNTLKDLGWDQNIPIAVILASDLTDGVFDNTWT